MKFHGLWVSLFCVLFLARAVQAQDTRLNSVPSSSVTAGTLSLSLKNGVDRAVKNNLAVILGAEEQKVADAKHLQDRAELYPKIEGFVAAAQQQINLASFGFSGFPGIQPIVGPFNFIDARATFTQSVLDFQRRHDLRESSEDRRAAAFTNANTRELVVLTAIDLYFQVVSTESRVTATGAAGTRKHAPRPRARLEECGRRPWDLVGLERCGQSSNATSGEECRPEGQAGTCAVGLPPAGGFLARDSLPPEGQALRPVMNSWRVYDRRPTRLPKLAFARRRKRSRRREPAAEVKVAGDYGANGPAPTNAHGPTYESGSSHADPRQGIGRKPSKEAALRQRQAERDSLHTY